MCRRRCWLAVIPQHFALSLLPVLAEISGYTGCKAVTAPACRVSRWAEQHWHWRALLRAPACFEGAGISWMSAELQMSMWTLWCSSEPSTSSELFKVFIHSSFKVFVHSSFLISPFKEVFTPLLKYCLNASVTKPWMKMNEHTLARFTCCRKCGSLEMTSQHWINPGCTIFSPFFLYKESFGNPAQLALE